MEIVEIKAGAIERVDEFLFGLGWKGVRVEIHGDCVWIVWVGRFGAEFQRMSGGEGCKKCFGWWAKV
jgi:hypothetical protein